ncbi:MAG TPA: GAF domain-containing protein [Ktedonobacteraceae bacterium]|nr:GAF domain-containing protein [Ktedonobacteraceae bacterium]
MQKFQSWREFLSTVISDRDEKFRLAQELNVTPLTLTRWVQGASTPQTQQLQSLLQALPRYQKTLHPLIAKEFEQMDLAVPGLTNQVIDIPSVFYAHVLSGSTALSHPIRFWSLANMVIQQALGQLDPLRLGLVIKVVCCMPPSGRGRILSLRESLGLGTSTRGSLEHTSVLLGAGSLASYAVISHQSVVIDRLADYDLFPAQERTPDEMSAAAHPIERGMRVAGCLFMASTQEGYFTPTRLSLLHRYADLLALVFASEDFYDIQAFDLQPMPPAQDQLRYLSSFRPRMAEVMVEATKAAQPIDTLRAEQQVWQQFEALFLDLPS